ncbi:hypothetical protein N656DRAFT_838135 [Canariomyces notabilis]|uniref:Methyltransferase domain-containing protein n=1 Tax=Canariomyces notabilis TaxID=2074819 RepID=A0AAN6QRG6_9PEZI|nr:hypothetical protein N656DRAFT_838135 [Canariomyces arenarius]
MNGHAVTNGEPVNGTSDHTIKNRQIKNGTALPNGWNGTFVNEKDPYALMRDCNANARLTAQHYLWRDLLGFLVHPSIPTAAVDLKVADVATGNGIWLHDLARDMPASVEFHGFDISLDQVVAKPWLPANIHMHTWDLFEQPPPEFVGYFDVVHVRLITVVVKHNDPRPVLANLTRILKPGGYLQWDEVDTIGCSVQSVPGVTAENLERLIAQLCGRDTWKSYLTQILGENGYADAVRHSYAYGLHMSRFWSDVYMATWKEFALKALKTPEESGRLERRAMEESVNGAAIMIPKLVWVARKL